MNIELTETRDAATLDRIIRDDAVYPFIIDDSCVSANEFTSATMLHDERVRFYLVMIDGALAGCFAFLDGELHTCLLKNCRGRAAVTAGRMAIERFEREYGQSVRSFAWREQPHTTWYAKAIGLKADGEAEWPVTRYGKKVTRINFIHERTLTCPS